MRASKKIHGGLLMHNLIKVTRLICIFSFITVLIVGCTSGGLNPTQPPISEQDESPLLTDTSLPTHEMGSTGGLMPVGFYDVTLDLESGEAVITPLRTTDITLNIMNLLQTPLGNPANFLIEITDLSQLADGIIGVDITVRHPFEMAQYTAFDAMLIMYSDGSIVSAEDPDVNYPGTDDLRLLNADGYTRWMNPVEFTSGNLFGFLEGNFGTKDGGFTATINGYKYYPTGIEATETVHDFFSELPNLVKRGAWMPGSAVPRNFMIQFPKEDGETVVRFQYGFIVRWEPALDEYGDPIPDPKLADFPLNANMPEAVHIAVDSSSSTAYYISETEKGGNLILDLTIYDWQAVLTPGGAAEQIVELIVEAPSGMIAGGVSFSTTDILNAQASSGPTHTQTILEIPNVVPTGLFEEILITVRSTDPTSYDQGFGTPYPESAHLAAYQRAIIDIKDYIPNIAPVIDEINGETMVNCFIGEEEYTVTAHDPDPGDTLTYKWEVTPDAVLPTFTDPLSTADICVIDWADNDIYPYGEWDVWVQVSDGIAFVKDHLDVTKSDEQLIAGMILADPLHVSDVTCDTTGEYTAQASDCNPDAILEYRFIRKFTTDETPPDSIDPDWTNWQSDPLWLIDWDNTEIGDWLIWAHVRETADHAIEDVSPALAVERINSIPYVYKVYGPDEVDCTDTDALYDAGIVDDCDAGQVHARWWGISETPSPSGADWTEFSSNNFVIDWSGYPSGLYYLFQKAHDGFVEYTCANSLDIERINTPPTVPTPSGLDTVFCDTVTDYTCEVKDCDTGDILTTQYYLSIEKPTPVGGEWITFTGTTFTPDFSSTPNREYWLFARADDGYGWVVCPQSLAVLKKNTPPVVGTPSGNTDVDCTEMETYTVDISDCDPDDLVQSWALSTEPDDPGSNWNGFTGNSFEINWEKYGVKPWYLFVKAEDGDATTICDPPLAIVNNNAAPVLEHAPEGPTTIVCGGEENYDVGLCSDCNLDADVHRYWIISDTDTLPPLGAPWTEFPFSYEKITVDWDGFETGTWYVIQKADDGTDVSWNSLEVDVEEGDLEVGIPDGPTPVDCEDTGAGYGVKIEDCDGGPEPDREWGLSFTNDPGGAIGWYVFSDDSFIVDWSQFPNGPSGDVDYYMFVRADENEGEGWIYGDAFVVHRQNTAPESPELPSGPENVSCAGSPYMYDFGTVSDCDYNEDLTRHWAVNTNGDFPPPDGPDWHEFVGGSTPVNWTGIPVGAGYLWQKVTDGWETSYCKPLKVSMYNSPPDKPSTPSGAHVVNCVTGLVKQYSTSAFSDCDDGQDELTYWGVSTSDNPVTVTPWHSYPGTQFGVDWGNYTPDVYYLFVKHGDGISHRFSLSLEVTYANTAPSVATPTGPATVSCTAPYQFDFGAVNDCDAGDTHTRWYAINYDSEKPPGAGPAWVVFAGPTAMVDFTGTNLGTAYIWQKVSDGHVERFCLTPKQVTMNNSPPAVPHIMSGPMSVNCEDGLIWDYTVIPYNDCDVGQSSNRYWGRSDTTNHEDVAQWHWFTGNEFEVDFNDFPFGISSLFVNDFDGLVHAYSDYRSVNLVNLPPTKPDTPSGPTLVNLAIVDPVQNYNVGTVSDCGPNQIVEQRHWCVGDSPSTPNGTWNLFPTAQTVIAIGWQNFGPGTWYVWQKATDGLLTSTSNPLEVTVGITTENVIYVSESGFDVWPGSWDQPVRNISVGLDKAETLGCTSVFVAIGDYYETERLDLVDGINIMGGRDDDDYWAEPGGTNYGNLHGPHQAVRGHTIVSPTTIRKLNIISANGNPGIFNQLNSTPVFLYFCDEDLRFERCRFDAGDGAVGDYGGTGTTGSNGGVGGYGEDGCENDVNPPYCGTCSEPAPGLPGSSSCGMVGGLGGHPGHGNSAPDDAGDDGDPGVAPDGYTPGGAGGPSMNMDGEPGSDGADGAEGGGGDGGDGIGSIFLGVWFGSPGTNGELGEHGAGGGGGGGSGGGMNGLCECYGGAGGGGAGGGCCGGGGHYGEGGGGSFAFYCYDSSPTLDYCAFYAGEGGNGGNGGFGGTGGSGGPGGLGGLATNGWTKAGDGGDAGDAGNGGRGGGGGGGVSYCIYKVGDPTPVLISPYYSTGKCGFGGEGGDFGPPGDGDNGLMGEKNW